MRKSLSPAWRLIAVLALAATLVAVPAVPAAAAGVSPDSFLNADGSLNLPADFSGSFDLDGWDVRLDPERGPLLQPAAATLGEWSAIGGVATGMVNAVHAIAVADGVIYVGGRFDDAGGVGNADHLAKFEGGAWSQVGSNYVPSGVFALVVNQGVLYIGGEFTGLTGVPNTNRVAQYDIATDTWSDMDGGLNANVSSMAVSGGTVYVGGEFTDAGGIGAADSIATFSGGAWGSLGTGIPTGRVSAIAIANGVVYAGGNFTDVGGDANADRIVKFEGADWVSLGGVFPGLNNTVRQIVVEDGIIYAAGEFSDAGGDFDADFVAKFSDGAWSALTDTPLNSWVNSMQVRAGVVYVAGNFTDAGGDAEGDRIAKIEDGILSSLSGAGSGLDNQVLAMAINGETLYAGGHFIDAGGDVNADKVAEFGLPPIPVEEIVATTSMDIASTGTTTLAVGDIRVSIPASAVAGLGDCRVGIDDLGGSGAFGFTLDHNVWDVDISCDGVPQHIFFAPITICIRPEGSISGKQVFHREDGGDDWDALAAVSSASGFVCAETRILSLFTLGSVSLPATGFAPGIAADLGAEPSYAATGLQLSIPKLGLSTDIVGVPQDINGWDVSWLGDSAGFLQGTAFPTFAGNTVITAHVWGADNQPGPFAELESLQHGDRFTISAWGSTYTYEVRSNESYRPSSLSPLGHADYDWVTLITCQGFDEASGEYLFRRVVRAVLVEVGN